MIIGLCGPIGAGKTTAALHLVKYFGFVRVRFAEPLKAMLRTLGLSAEDVDGSAKDHPSLLLGGKTPRWAMQSLGTEWGRDLIDGELWVRAWARAAGHYQNVVADDVRFPNEVEAIHGSGGKLIRVVRPGHSVAADHASELHALEADLTLLNNGDVTALTTRMEHLVGPLLGPKRALADPLDADDARLAELDREIAAAPRWGAALAAKEEERQEILCRIRRRAILGAPGAREAGHT